MIASETPPLQQLGVLQVQRAMVPMVAILSIFLILLACAPRQNVEGSTIYENVELLVTSRAKADPIKFVMANFGTIAYGSRLECDPLPLSVRVRALSGHRALSRPIDQASLAVAAVACSRQQQSTNRSTIRLIHRLASRPSCPFLAAHFRC